MLNVKIFLLPTLPNADTPFYRPRDIDFESMLAEKKAAMFATNEPKLELANTNASHMHTSHESHQTKTTLFFRDGHMARNDGNSVDLDVETSEMSKIP